MRIEVKRDSIGSVDRLTSSVHRLFQARRIRYYMAKITLLPTHASAEVPDGELLVEAGELAGVEMEAGCFSCSCGTCVAEVVSGMENLSPATDEELDVLDQWNKDSGTHRLTCCVRLLKGECTLRTGH